MTKEEKMEKLTAIFRDLLDEEEFELEETTSKENLEEWDSLFQITLVAAISNEFGIEIATDDILKVTSVENILAILG